MKAILTEKYLFYSLMQKKYFYIFLACLTLFSSLAVWFLKPPVISGDGTTYAEAMAVLSGGALPDGFVPNRILTTFLGLETIIFLSYIFGSIPTAWLALNIFFYFLLNGVFYKIIHLVFQNEKIALLGGLFLAGNYAMLAFGVNYLMDIGGWTMYVASLYFTLRYVQKGLTRDIVIAAVFVGIGGLYKEYAFLGSLSIGCVLLYRHGISWSFLRKSLMTGVIACAPIIVVSFFVFSHFHYTYLDWLGFNSETYVYDSKSIEYVKSFGSLLTVLIPLFFAGAYCMWKYGKEIVTDREACFFVLSVVVSALPVFVWPAITQRVLFITTPAVVLVSCFAFKRHERYWPIFAGLLVLYVLLSFFMDSHILNAVNLPI